MTRMEIDFPGGFRVRARYEGFRIETDQPIRAGGDGSAPAPFDHFLASIGTCAGAYLLGFLRERKLPASGIRLSLEWQRDPEHGRVSGITIHVQLPRGFPEKYRSAVARAVDSCAVKKHILEPPRFETVVEIGDEAVAAAALQAAAD
jgi:ribosomal protein S12 methylthiotransferase accessory factor